VGAEDAANVAITDQAGQSIGQGQFDLVATLAQFGLYERQAERGVNVRFVLLATILARWRNPIPPPGHRREPGYGLPPRSALPKFSKQFGYRRRVEIRHGISHGGAK
jgi:hypothetical protein